MEVHVVKEIVAEFVKLTQNPEIFIEPQLETADRFKKLAKQIYEYAVASNDLANLKAKSLKKLLINGFDEEQIWQQIEIQNDAALPYLQKTVPNINLKDVLFAVQGIGTNSTEVKNNFGISDESDIEEDYAFDDDSDSSTVMVEAIKKKAVAHDNDSDSSTDMFAAVKRKDVTNDDDSDFSVEYSKVGKKQIPRKELAEVYTSEVDDQFFKLSKLEQFLKIEDLKESKDDEDMSDDNGIDLFQDIPSDNMDEGNEDSDEEDIKTKKSSKDVMYEDFFDDPESGDESVGNLTDNEDMNGFAKGDASHEAATDEEIKSFECSMKNKEDKAVTDHFISTNTQKTAFELEQEKIKMQIQEHEKSILEPMSWQLTGEVAASSRPVDSLIHQETEFDSNVKQDLPVDNILNERLDTIIKVAIINKAFNDVERKVKPTEDVIAYKKEVALEQTKSKKGLAEVYEEDYLKKQTKQKEEDDPKHKEIQKLGDSIFAELHALFSYIPKPAVPDIKIVSNLPAVAVEEVAPTSVSDVTLLAPEEVKKKSGLVKGTTERTDTDRKRERRKKKIHQKFKEKKKLEKLESQKANPSGRVSKLEKLVALKKLKQNKNTKIASVDEGGKIKSSKDFFSRLQDTMDSKTKIKNKVPYKKKKT